MNMLNRNAMPKAQDVLRAELAKSGVHKLEDPAQVADALNACLEAAYQQLRSACAGDQTRTRACDTLFREAKEGLNLARAAAAAVQAEVDETASLPETAEEQVDWIQPLLLLAAALLALAGSVRGLNVLSVLNLLNLLPTLMGLLAVLCILAALMREAAWMFGSGKLAALLLRLAKKKRKLQWLAKAAGLIKKAPAKGPAAPAVKMAVTKTIDPAALTEALMKQMAVIDSNLPLFSDPVQQADAGQELLPMVRAMLQEKYAARCTYPEAVEVQLQQYLAANGLICVEYAEEQAHLFQTQPMAETFTIYPAIIDREGRIVEQGFAGVKEG